MDKTAKLDRPTQKIGEHLQDALIHLENIAGISAAEKEQVAELLNKAFEIVTAVRS